VAEKNCCLLKWIFLASLKIDPYMYKFSVKIADSFKICEGFYKTMRAYCVIYSIGFCKINTLRWVLVEHNPVLSLIGLTSITILHYSFSSNTYLSLTLGLWTAIVFHLVFLFLFPLSPTWRVSFVIFILVIVSKWIQWSASIRHTNILWKSL